MSAECSVPAPPDSFARTLSPPSQDCVQSTVKLSKPDTVNLQPGLSRDSARTLSPPRQACVPDIVNLQPGRPCDIAQLLEDSQKEIIQIRKHHTQKLVFIFQRNKILLFSFLHVLKSMYSLTPRMTRFYNTLYKLEKMSPRMIKRICKALISRGLIDPTWLEKPQIDFAISSEDNKPMLDVKLNDITATAVLDINSNYTFVPYAIWMRLNLNPNALDNSVTVNNHDALGLVKLSFSIRNDKKIYQLIRQKCLILKPTSQSAYIHLGFDFLSSNFVSMSYFEKGSPPLTTINDEIIPLLSKTNALNQHHDLAPPESHPVDSSDLLPQASASPTTAPGLCDHSPATS